MTALHAVDQALQAGQRTILLIAGDEERALELLANIAREHEWPLHTWSAASGTDYDEQPIRFLDLLLTLRHDTAPGLWVALDGAPHLQDPIAVRHLREFAQRGARGPALVILDPTGAASPHVGLQTLIDRIPELKVHALALPDRDEIAEAVRSFGTRERGRYPGLLTTLPEHLDDIVHACLGLERMHLPPLLLAAVSEHGGHWPDIVAHVRVHKSDAVDKTALLEPVAPVPIDAVGGLPHFKAWLRRRKLALAPAARAAAVPAPRGVLLLGVPGCGKSWAARATADALGLPLVRLDPGRLFGGTVGASEANLRRLIATAERLAPVVLWLDEIDKSLAGIDGAQSDAGTTSRVVGALLTWLQERSAAVFVVATANRVETLPPELLRRGRLDEIFFIDLPDADERQAILRIHLELLPARMLGAAPPMADPWSAFAAVVARADGRSGAEIESALIEARLAAFAEGRALRARDFEEALAPLIPLSVSHREELEHLRAWARTRARPG